MVKKKTRKKNFWALKVFLITIILAAGISVAAGSLTGNVSAVAAVIILFVIMLIGIVFDIIAIAFASCDPAPFVSMASRKIRSAKSAIRLLQNADIVSNICGDVVGDICGIVSGATGAAIAIKISVESNTFIWAIVISSLIASLTVAGKALGKSIAIRKNKEIVGIVSFLLMFFFKDNKGASNERKK